MNAKAVEVLLALQSERKSTKSLAKSIGVTYVRASQLVRQLLQEGFVTKTEGLVGLADTAHAALFRKVASKFDVKKLLVDSAEKVGVVLQSPRTVAEIQRHTGLSYWTIRRSLVNLMQIGAAREESGKYSLVDDEELKFFLKLLEERGNKMLAESYAEVIYSSQGCLLKRVPQGKEAEGSLTAFSAFSMYGVDLRPVYQYFIQPKKALTVDEILVHALVFSENPVELTDCAVFYAKNRDSIDQDKSKELAKKFGVQDSFTDLKGYVSNLTIPSPERFLPWEEFADKARLYGFSPEMLVPRPAYPDLVKKLAKKITKDVKIFVFGGEAMRIRGLKRATKDIDVVVEDSREFKTLGRALTSMGYRTLGGTEISKSDLKLDPSGIFVSEGSPRIDIFVKTICNKFKLSGNMKSRSDCQTEGRLSLCLMSNEDIFLLKSITDREGDIYDMIQLAKTRNFRWEVILDELYHQEQKTTARFCLSVLDSIEMIQERANIRAPFYNKLVNHCIDHAILDVVHRRKLTTLLEIRELIDYPDYRLRSRVEKLVRERKLVKRNGRLTPRATSRV